MKKDEEKIEWVVVRGKRVPKLQLEEAVKGLDELMDDHDTQYRRMEDEIKDPDKKFDVHDLLYWKHIFMNDKICERCRADTYAFYGGQISHAKFSTF